MFTADNVPASPAQLSKEYKLMNTSVTQALEAAIERRTFDQCRFRFVHLTTEEMTKELLGYMDKESFSGSFRFRRNAATFQICSSYGSSDSLLSQVWNSSVFHAATSGQAGDCIAPCDSLEDFVTQWGTFGYEMREALREWVKEQNDRDEWETDGYTCTVWVCDKGDWEAAVEGARSALREQAKEEFDNEWEWATSDDATDEEILYSSAYDKASSGRSKFYMPRKSAVEWALADLHGAARSKREKLLAAGYEKALRAHLETLNLED